MSRTVKQEIAALKRQIDGLHNKIKTQRNMLDKLVRYAEKVNRTTNNNDEKREEQLRWIKKKLLRLWDDYENKLGLEHRKKGEK